MSQKAPQLSVWTLPGTNSTKDVPLGVDTISREALLRSQMLIAPCGGGT